MTLPDGLIYDGNQRLQQKLQHFHDNSSHIHIVADFDRTLTQRRTGTYEDITSWNILRDHLPPEAQTECQRLFQIARPKELAGTMTEQDAIEWWSNVLNIFTEHQLDMNAVERDFLNRASVRNGSKELFDLCDSLQIPTIILSAGVKEVIDLWASKYTISPSLVLSTELVLDENRHISGWKRDTLIHILNKSEIDHPELNRIRAERPLSIIFGDSINDSDMAIGEDDVLRIRIYDPRPDEVAEIENERARTFEKFDLMVESGSLEPLVELLKLIAR